MNAPQAKTKKIKLEVNELRKVLNYDPETGMFTWMNSERAGNANARGYVSIWHQGVHYYAHRLAWEWVAGSPPQNDIDHINQIKSDNRFTNLRESTRSENMFNRGKNRNNLSGTKGVSFCKTTGKWKAQISVDRKYIHIGRFNTIEEAGKAYLERAKLYRGDFATC